MIALKRIEIDHTQDVALIFASDGDPTSDGITAGVNSLCFVIGGTLTGNLYRKSSAPDTGWTIVVNAHA